MQPFIHNSAINTIKIIANEKSDARDKIHISNNNVSHPIRNLDSIKSKKSSHQNISFIKRPTYNIVLNQELYRRLSINLYILTIKRVIYIPQNTLTF